MPLTDPLFAPLIGFARACLCAAVADHPNPPAVCCVRWGDHTTVGVSMSLDECCAGVAWVRWDGAAPTDDASFPGPSAQVDKCASPVRQWAVDLAIGIARCAPTGDPRTGPTCAQWADLKAAQAADAAALRRMLCCLGGDVRYSDVVASPIRPAGPEGGCVQQLVDLTVRVVGCDECALVGV